MFFSDGDLNGACNKTLLCTGASTVCFGSTGRCTCVLGYSEFEGSCVEGK